MINRLRRIEGQVRGVQKMIESDIYCDNVLNQLTSITQALNGVKKTLLEAHFRSCVIDKIKNKDYSIVDELMKTIAKMLK